MNCFEEEKDTIPMSLVGSEDACSDNSLISLKAGTPQFDEEQHQICARLRIYIKYQYFVLPCRTSSGLLCSSYIDDMNMYNDLKRRDYM